VINDATGAIAAITETSENGTVPPRCPREGRLGLLLRGTRAYYSGVVDPPDGATIPFVLYTAEPELPPRPSVPVTSYLITLEVPDDTADLHLLDCGSDLSKSSWSHLSVLRVLRQQRRVQDRPTHSFLGVALDGTGAPIAWGSAFDQ